MTPDDKRAAVLADRVVAGLSSLGAAHRRRVLKAIADAYCSGCGHELFGCSCSSYAKIIEQSEGVRG